MGAAASLAFGTNAPLAGDLYCRIAYFHAVPSTQDVDNIIKSILDALKGVVFQDDVAIVQCLTSKVDIRKNYAISNGNAPGGAAEELTVCLEGQPAHTLYVEVGSVLAQRIVFGPIDGESP